MSAPTTTTPRRPMPPAFGPGRMLAAGMPAEKALDFKGSTRRLLRMLAPDRLVVTAVLLLGTASVALAVIGPKVLGRATDIIFSGVVGARLQPGTTKAQAVAGLRAHGQNKLADMLQAMHVVPGQGIDFGHLARVLAWVLVIYLFAAGLGMMQFRLTTVIVQRAVFRLREQVEAKLSRLPLSYFDKQPRGEVLSRATNDTDNVAQTLQQTLSQLLTSLLTIVGVLVMMVWISPLLAVIALVTVPLSVYVTTRIGKRAQPQFVKQWASTGRLNGHIEEMFTGHTLVTAFGRQHEAGQTFTEHNDALFAASFRASSSPASSSRR